MEEVSAATATGFRSLEEDEQRALEQRRQVAAVLREQGHSLRAIAGRVVGELPARAPSVAHS